MSRIQGQIHRITNPLAFATSYRQTGGKPTAGFERWGRLRVHLVTDFPGGRFGSSMPPAMSLKTDADSQGRFHFDTPAPMHAFRGQVQVYEVDTVPAPVPGMPPLPVLKLMYRSAPFSLAQGGDEQPLYLYPAKTPTGRGISQEALDAQLRDLRRELHLDRLRATIGKSKVSVRAEKDGGDLRFDAHVRGSTSADLDRIIEIKAGEIDIDLPGPDAIVGLCVDKDDIEAAIRKGLSKLSGEVSRTLLDELSQALPGVTDQASVSVWRTRHVATGERVVKVPGPVPDVKVPVFTLVPDAAFGLPRRWG